MFGNFSTSDSWLARPPPVDDLPNFRPAEYTISGMYVICGRQLEPWLVSGFDAYAYMYVYIYIYLYTHT